MANEIAQDLQEKIDEAKTLLTNLEEAKKLRFENDIRALVMVSIGVLLVLTALTTVLRFVDVTTSLNQKRTEESSIEALSIQAVESANFVLSFLEGASVIVAVALGAAAIYGFRSSQETRAELREEIKLLSEQRKELDEQLGELEQYRSQLDNFERLEGTLKDNLDMVLLLLQTYEMLESQNHKQAYEFVSRILEQTQKYQQAPNKVALYWAGWLEVHHIPNKLEIGIRHLRQAYDLDPEWQSARAAYAVGLRRRGLQCVGDEQKNYYNQAETLLLSVLHYNPYLTDPNSESFYGPLGGIYRDTGRLEDAIKAYEKALEVTPESSYPKGNLASLYLWKLKNDRSNMTADKVVRMFRESIKSAESELAYTPNGYFQLMDRAMSTVILAREDRKFLVEAKRYLAEALKVDSSCNLLDVSLRGWERLLEYCPEDEDWSNVYQALIEAIETLKAEIRERGCV